MSKTTKNLKMAAQLNQELSPTELRVCAVAQEAGLRGAAWGWPGAGRAGKSKGRRGRACQRLPAGGPGRRLLAAPVQTSASPPLFFLLCVTGAFGCPRFPAPPAEKELPLWPGGHSWGNNFTGSEH